MRRAYALRAMSMIRHPESCESLQVSALGADCFFVRRPCESRDPYSVSPRFWHALCHIARTRRMGPCFRRDDQRERIERFTNSSCRRCLMDRFAASPPRNDDTRRDTYEINTKKNRTLAGPVLVLPARGPTITFQRGTVCRHMAAIWEDGQPPTVNFPSMPGDALRTTQRSACQPCGLGEYLPSIQRLRKMARAISVFHRLSA